MCIIKFMNTTPTECKALFNGMEWSTVSICLHYCIRFIFDQGLTCIDTGTNKQKAHNTQITPPHTQQRKCTRSPEVVQYPWAPRLLGLLPALVETSLCERALYE